MKKKKALLIIFALLLVLTLAVAVYASDYYRAEDAAIAAVTGSHSVGVVRTDDVTVFTPENPVAGMIFYPGGKVEHTAYAPLMLALAREDILCVLVRMPLNLAVLDMDAAEGIREWFPDVENWYIGGHSLGGSMAASWAAENAGQLEGLVLLAAYSTADLTETGLDVLSVYGDRDRVMNPQKYAKYLANLPESHRELVISGGNHALFGNYGPQEGDGEATITGREQTAITVRAILDLINS